MIKNVAPLVFTFMFFSTVYPADPAEALVPYFEVHNFVASAQSSCGQYLAIAPKQLPPDSWFLTRNREVPPKAPTFYVHNLAHNEVAFSYTCPVETKRIQVRRHYPHTGFDSKEAEVLVSVRFLAFSPDSSMVSVLLSIDRNKKRILTFRLEDGELICSQEFEVEDAPASLKDKKFFFLDDYRVIYALPLNDDWEDIGYKFYLFDTSEKTLTTTMAAGSIHDFCPANGQLYIIQEMEDLQRRFEDKMLNCEDGTSIETHTYYTNECTSATFNPHNPSQFITNTAKVSEDRIRNSQTLSYSWKFVDAEEQRASIFYEASIKKIQPSLWKTHSIPRFDFFPDGSIAKIYLTPDSKTINITDFSSGEINYSVPWQEDYRLPKLFPDSRFITTDASKFMRSHLLVFNLDNLTS